MRTRSEASSASNGATGASNVSQWFWSAEENQLLMDSVASRRGLEDSDPTVPKQSMKQMMVSIVRNLNATFSTTRTSAAVAMHYTRLLERGPAESFEASHPKLVVVLKVKFEKMVFRFSDQQKAILQREVLHGEGFRPSTPTVQSLAARLNVPVVKVRSWFSNCRLGHFPFCRHLLPENASRARNEVRDADPVDDDDLDVLPSRPATNSKRPPEPFVDEDVDELLQRPSKKAALSASKKLRQLEEKIAELEAQEAMDLADREEKSAAHQEASRKLSEACEEKIKTSAAYSDSNKTHNATRKQLWQIRDERLELLQALEQ